MKSGTNILLTLLVIAFAVLWSTQVSATSIRTFRSTLEVKPGESIGVYKLGMTVAQAKNVSKKWKKERYGQIFRAGRYRLLFHRQTKRLTMVQFNLWGSMTRLKLGHRYILPTHDPYRIVSQLGSCEPQGLRIGGNLIYCAQRKLAVVWTFFRGSKHLRIDVSKGPTVTTAPKPVCGGYIVPGRSISQGGLMFHASKAKPATWMVKKGQTFCLRQMVLKTNSRPSLIPKFLVGECQTQRNRGATTVYCNHTGLVVVFAGPTLTLHQIRLYHHSKLPMPFTRK